MNMRSSCSIRQVVCRACPDPITTDEDRRSCEAKCNWSFHKDCWKWPDMKCTRHYCFKCYSRDVYMNFTKFFPNANFQKDRDELYHCIRCSM